MKTAYPNTQTTCKIRLYSNIPFDNTYNHHPLLSKKFTYNGTSLSDIPASEDIRERFLDRKDILGARIYPKYDLTGDFNFDFNDGISASVTLELTPAQTNANYLKLTCGDDVYYYFITHYKQENFDTYTLTLELDVIMTYQDEFLDGMKDMPVFTKRKHDHIVYGSQLRCEDLASKDSVFAGVEPDIIVDEIKLHFKDDMKYAEGLVWLYICVDNIGQNLPLLEPVKEMLCYKTNKSTYPMCMLAIPLNADFVNIYVDNAIAQSYTSDQIKTCVHRLINSGYVHGAKISYYPPFVQCYTGYNTITKDNVTGIHVNYYCSSSNRLGPDIDAYKFTSYDGNEFITDTTGWNATLNDDLSDLTKCGAILITKQKNTRYDYADIDLNNLTNEYNQFSGNITEKRKTDPKLHFPPFLKYELRSYYTSDCYEINPAIRFTNYKYDATTSYGTLMQFSTITTGYIGDNSVFNFLKPITDLDNRAVMDYFRQHRIGLSSNMNYIEPCGTDALDIFNATQRQSFYTSKVASGITSGLSIVGGAASIVGGAVATATGVGAPMAFGMFSAGGAMIAGGTAGLGQTIASSIAKENELRNTPNTINISGSTFALDEGVEGAASTGLPFLLRKWCNISVIEKGNDFFYDYGYEVCRCCYFNTELKVNNSVNTFRDNNLFTRTIFNYIKLEEDIVNKINTDIPLIVKKKLNDIFNAGITLWTFFGFKVFYKNGVTLPTSTYLPDKWLLKNEYENTQYMGDVFPII